MESSLVPTELVTVVDDGTTTNGVPNQLKVNADGSTDINIVSPIEQNGGVPVNIQDQTSQPIDTYFLQSISNFTISIDTVASGIEPASLVYTFEATAGHGILNPVGGVNDEILLLDVVGDRSFYAEVLNVTVNTVTIDRPIDHVFPAATTLGRIVISNMNVDGSVTPQIFSLRAGVSPLDFVRFMITITDGNSMDDSTFGSLPKLTRGMVLRIVNGFQETIFNFKTNGDVAQWCYDTKYPDKKPAGQFGFNARVTFGGQSKHGVVLRISNNSVIQMVVQDDLTDLDEIRWSAEGHKVTD